MDSNNRVFVNFPKWTDSIPLHVAEIVNGQLQAYPNINWNDGTINSTSEASKTTKFKAIQSVFIDKLDRLWVLETSNPQFKGVDSCGPIVYQFDLSTNQLANTYTFAPGVYLPNSYFNDIRIDEEDQKAYLTDSSEGAIIVLDLISRQARRLLAKHPTVMAEVDQLICNGVVWEGSVNSDGLDLNPDRSYLYFSALSGHSLYRVSTKNLNDTLLMDSALGNAVELVTNIPATDGMLFDPKGRLWLGGLENDCVNMLDTQGKIQSFHIGGTRWADSFALDSNSMLYTACSQIHLPVAQRGMYEVCRFKIN